MFSSPENPVNYSDVKLVQGSRAYVRVLIEEKYLLYKTRSVSCSVKYAAGGVNQKWSERDCVGTSYGIGCSVCRRSQPHYRYNECLHTTTIVAMRLVGIFRTTTTSALESIIGNRYHNLSNTKTSSRKPSPYLSRCTP